jgi:hypothetical protein
MYNTRILCTTYNHGIQYLFKEINSLLKFELFQMLIFYCFKIVNNCIYIIKNHTFSLILYPNYSRE